jgi:hypothetical protein
MSTEWSESQTELLKRLWIGGESARTIAEKLGQGITRNAVIGSVGLRLRVSRAACGAPQTAS